jgi:sec-independent protein translocase protein TatC
LDIPTKKNLEQPAPKKKQIHLDEPVSLFEHLGELRKRLTYSLIAVTVGGIACYPAVDWIIRDMAKPMGKLYFTGPVEAFWCRIKIAFFLGLLASLPVVLFQVWSFIQHGLLPREKRFILSVTTVSFALFIGGAAFCYFLVIPTGVQFLIAYKSDVLQPMITISSYLSFVTTLIVSFGLVFELPVAIGFLTKIGVFNSKMLRDQWRFAVVIIFIAAAALTPGPDIFSQLIMATPLLVLYGVSIIVAMLIEKRRK